MQGHRIHYPSERCPYRSIVPPSCIQRLAQRCDSDVPRRRDLLLAAAVDPNPHRRSLIEDVQHGAFVRELA
ncbi:hypothetical protein BRD04_06730 [Halobacteriales archaeon QS_9_67_17]|nr:MAG: hypothetical protein BRD04_06730 [Halobacteriales archaeon QS_9_67_17]